ncbi:MAG TPA: NmrA family NAD(P)-binding protein [Bryobacteraceae bacterium]|jgi:uncharacterized protein YbjT (DUF2867 family)|nr:NmrA family NAD(P)-binding protein [Bryobacteraceae bacterium]
MTRLAPKPIFVTGATGNVGRNVVSILSGTGAPVRALTRHPEAAGLPDSVEVVRGDLSDPSTLENSLEEVDSVFLMVRDFSVPIAPIMVSLAKHVRRIVFLSSAAIRDELPVQTNPVGKIHLEVEEATRKTGLEWTFLRPGAFAANALAWWGPQLRAGDVVRWPYGAAASAPIHERDIAAVAVRALTGERHAGKKYSLTGGDVLTQFEQLQIIGDATGRTLRYEELMPDAARQQMGAFLPPFIVDVMLDVMARTVETPAPVTRTVEEVTGAPPAKFQQWALDHAKDFQVKGERG